MEIDESMKGRMNEWQTDQVNKYEGQNNNIY